MSFNDRYAGLADAVDADPLSLIYDDLVAGKVR